MAVNKWWEKKDRSGGASDSKYPKGIKDWEIERGGYRRDEDQNSYSLTWRELLEFEQQSDVTPDDDKFYEWFADFRKEKHITKTSTYSTRSYSDVSWEADEPKKKDGWLSGWWSKDVLKGWGSYGSGHATKLALALQAVRSVIRVVDDTIPPMTVSWANQDESYTDFTNRKIVVNPKPITAGKLEDGHAIDVATGFALHEASHSQYSRKPYETLTKPTELAPMQIAGVLLNIAEDVRIEAMTGAEYPGFKGYFERTLAWAWEEMKSTPLPKTYGPDLKSKMTTLLLACRWPVEAKTVLTDKSFAPEIEWWEKWRDDYLAETFDARTTVEHGLEHLREPTEEEKKAGKPSKAGGEMDELSKAEEELKKMIADLNSRIDELIRQGMRDFADGKACLGKIGEDPLTEIVARQVDTLVDSELKVDKPTLPAPSGMTAPPIHILHPKEDTGSRRAYIGKPAAILQRLKAALVFRQELPRWNERLLKEGTLDDEELWRWKDKDYRVFGEEIIINRPRVQMGMLVDMSGSMNSGSKLKTAQELAQLLLIAAKDMDGVTPVVWGHTGDHGDRTCDIFRLWEVGEPVTRLGLISSLYHSNNYDGFAIEWCAKQLIQRGQMDEQRVLIVLSDGYPAGSTYGGHEAEVHMRQVGDWALKNGVVVIQVAIDEAVRPERQAAMFREWVQFTNMQELPKQLAKLLAKHT